MKYLLIITLSIVPLSIFSQIHNWTRINPGGGGSFEAAGIGPTGTILVASDLSGAYRSVNGGVSWQPIGSTQGLTTTHISAVGFHPTDGNIAYLGSESGIFRSTDGGINFTEVLTSGYIGDIKFAPSNTNTGYAAYNNAWNSVGTDIYKTTDNGVTWAQVSTNLPNNVRILKIVINPSNADILYVLSGKSRFADGTETVYKSTDGGVTFSQIATGLSGIGVMDITIHPTTPTTLYLTTYYLSGFDTEGYFYRSTDSGASWTQRSTRTGVILVDKDTPSNIRLIDPSSQFLWRDPVNGVWQSTNEGTSWTRICTLSNMNCGYQTLNATWDHYWTYGYSYSGFTHTFGESMVSGSTFLWINNQFVFQTTNGGASFAPIHTTNVGSDLWKSTGVDNVVTQDFAVSEADPNVLYGGYWDIGIWRSLDRGVSWQSGNSAPHLGNNTGWVRDGKAYGGNVYAIAADPTRADVVWAMMKPEAGGNTDPATVVKSTNSGQKDSWVTSHSGIPTSSYAILGFSVDRNSTSTNRTLFVTASGDVYRSTNDGASWSRVLNNGGIRTTAIDNFNSNYVYAGGENGFWRSTDGGTTWTETGLTAMRGGVSGPPWESGWQGTYDIEADPNVADRVYVVAYGTGKGLWRSNDKGATWTKLVTDDYMRAIAVAIQNSNIIYTGSSSAYYAGGYSASSQGIRYSNNGGSSWTDANNGMAWKFANVIKTDNMGRVYAGSPGTGYQYSLIPDIAVPVQLIRFDVEPRNSTVILHWQTSNEVNNSGFEIERSENGSQFETLGFVGSKGDAALYQFTDNAPLKKGFYRLRQIDLDGKFSYSKIVHIQQDASWQISTYPNPADQEIMVLVDGPGKDAHPVLIGIYDLNGRLIEEKTVEPTGNAAVSISTTHYTPGVYFVQTTVGSSQTRTEKVIIMH